jgi:hypothetical protein
MSRSLARRDLFASPSLARADTAWVVGEADFDVAAHSTTTTRRGRSPADDRTLPARASALSAAVRC